MPRPRRSNNFTPIALFERRNLAGEGRLGDVDAFGGAGEAARLGDRVKGAKLRIIYRHNLYHP